MVQKSAEEEANFRAVVNEKALWQVSDDEIFGFRG
jgi:hypothetical protein